eukprot:GHVN01051069.1.p1 GENE.GHVN01051069.1~~GHVN01051069.1.p1  ORF type:complete len:105 (+),score=8.88 GHVN01051069.1:287-601(+)
METNEDSPNFVRLDLPGASVYQMEGMLSVDDCDDYFRGLHSSQPWELRKFHMFGRECSERRGTLFFSSPPGVNYRYSGRDNVGVEVGRTSMHPTVIGAVSIPPF